MATTNTANGFNAEGNKEYGGSVSHHDHANYNDGNLTRAETNQSARVPAFGGEAQPGSYRPTTHRKFGNPAPLGLSAFALTTFILSLINMQARGVAIPNIVVGCAYAYGGLVQLLAGMWEMAVGNTFGATALSSYGGFWISYAMIETAGGFGIVSAYGDDAKQLEYAIGFYLIGWFIFTFILVICTLRSTLAFFLLFFTLDMTFLLLAIARFQLVNGAANVPVTKAGGFFGLLAAFLAWYNAWAGICDPSNSFFQPHVVHFPWSDKGREARGRKTSVV